MPSSKQIADFFIGCIAVVVVLALSMAWFSRLDEQARRPMRVWSFQCNGQGQVRDYLFIQRDLLYEQEVCDKVWR